MTSADIPTVYANYADSDEMGVFDPSKALTFLASVKLALANGGTCTPNDDADNGDDDDVEFDVGKP